MRRILGFLIAVLLILVPVGITSASNYANVTVNATPAYISISVNQTTYAFGVIAESSVTNTTGGYFGITNASTVQTDQTIAVTGSNWTGGAEWNHSDTCTPATATAGMKAQRVGQSWIIVKNSSPNYIYENCPATTNYAFDLSLHAPTTFTDGVIKQNVVSVYAVSG